MNSVLGRLSLYCALEFKYTSPNSELINPIKSWICDDSLHDLGKGSVSDIQNMLKIADDLSWVMFTSEIEQGSWKSEFESWS